MYCNVFKREFEKLKRARMFDLRSQQHLGIFCRISLRIIKLIIIWRKITFTLIYILLIYNFTFKFLPWPFSYLEHKVKKTPLSWFPLWWLHLHITFTQQYGNSALRLSSQVIIHSWNFLMVFQWNMNQSQPGLTFQT